MHEARARIEAEAQEPDLARRGLEGHRIMVRHGDIKRRAVHVLRARRAADIAVVLGRAIGRADDQRLAQPVAQGLQLVERLGCSFSCPVPRQAISAGEKFGQRQRLSGTSRKWRKVRMGYAMGSARDLLHIQKGRCRRALAISRESVWRDWHGPTMLKLPVVKA
jgi:hypothetical protein